MDFVNQLSNSVAYSVHTATYNPEAEQYAKQQQDDKEANQAAKAAADKKQVEAEAAKKAADEAKAKQVADEERRTFSMSRLLSRVFRYTMYAAFVVGLLIVSLMSASYAVNLNIYRPWPQRLFYAVYGFLFSIFSFPYIVFYRSWYLGHSIPSYGVLPLFETEEASPFTKSFLPFLVFARDEHIDDMKEWEPAHSSTEQAGANQRSHNSEAQPKQ
jgi:hypothetical protein